MNMLKRMALRRAWRAALVAGLSPVALGWLGCCHDRVGIYPPRPLGSYNDQAFRTQEENAEAWKYVVYMHEFQLNESTIEGENPGGWKLNEAGEDHIRQIAVNLKRGDHYPIVLERSDTSSRAGTEFGYPVHFNDELDSRRRQVLVAALTSLGIPDADQRVVVAPAASEGMESSRAAQAYNNSLGDEMGGGGMFGWGMGGMGGMGGGGMF